MRHAELPAQRRHLPLELRPADEQGRLGIAQEVADLADRVGGVERQVDGTGPQAAQVEHQRLGALLDLRRDAVAGLDAQVQEDLGHPARQVLQVGVAEHAAVGPLQEDAAEVGREAAAEDLEQVLVHATVSGAGWIAGRCCRTAFEATTVPSLAKASWLASMKRRS